MENEKDEKQSTDEESNNPGIWYGEPTQGVPDDYTEGVSAKKRGRPPKKKEPGSVRIYNADVSGVHAVFFPVVSALFEHYSEEDEDPTIQMEIRDIAVTFTDGHKDVAWKRLIQVLEQCLDINLRQS